MNFANALGEISYRTIRVDDLDIFYRESGPKDEPSNRSVRLISTTNQTGPKFES